MRPAVLTLELTLELGRITYHSSWPSQRWSSACDGQTTARKQAGRSWCSCAVTPTWQQPCSRPNKGTAQDFCFLREVHNLSAQPHPLTLTPLPRGKTSLSVVLAPPKGRASYLHPQHFQQQHYNANSPNEQRLPAELYPSMFQRNEDHPPPPHQQPPAQHPASQPAQPRRGQYAMREAPGDEEKAPHQQSQAPIGASTRTAGSAGSADVLMSKLMTDTDFEFHAYSKNQGNLATTIGGVALAAASMLGMMWAYHQGCTAEAPTRERTWRRWQ